MLERITDKDTLLALLKADKPIAFVAAYEDGELTISDFNEGVNNMLKDSYVALLADFEDEPDEDPEEPEENEQPEPEPEEPWPADEPEEPEPALSGFKPIGVEKKRGPKAIDKGEVKALYNAGWTEHQIADEIGCVQPRIHKVIEGMKERGEL